MCQEHKNTITQNKLKQLKSAGLVASHDLRPAWKQSRPILTGKGKEVDK